MSLTSTGRAPSILYRIIGMICSGEANFKSSNLHPCKQVPRNTIKVFTFKGN